MKKQAVIYSLIIISALGFQQGCKKDMPISGNSTAQEDLSLLNKKSETHKYDADLANAWMNMQLQIMRTATGIPNVAFVRPFAYSGIVFYESVVEGMNDYKSLSGQLNGMPAMPSVLKHMDYNWALSANAGMASILKKMYPTTSTVNIDSINSLEIYFNNQFGAGEDAAVISRSVTFGQNVAQLIYDWAQTDGYLHASDPYTAPTGPGLWVPTPTAFVAPSTPYWGNLRPMVLGSGNSTMPPAPTPYSEDPASAFYQMAKHVYDVSQTLTPEQTAMGLFWKDIPGVTTPGHYISIIEQVIVLKNSHLDKAAVAYVLCGITAYDAAISVWKAKYTYNLVRPVTYIRNVLGHTTWLPLLSTPAHPEYSGAHAFLSAATARALEDIYGKHVAFTDHTYDYLGMTPRTYGSFKEFGEDAGNSRVFAGIHYQPTIDLGLIQGRVLAENILHSIKFKK